MTPVSPFANCNERTASSGIEAQSRIAPDSLTGSWMTSLECDRAMARIFPLSIAEYAKAEELLLRPAMER